MATFVASLKNEIKKIFSRKKFIVFLIIEVIICLIYGGVNLILERVSHGVWANIGLMGMSMNLLSFFLQVYIPLIVFMAACDLFTTEFHDGTIRATFMRPVSRWKQFASKVTAILILAVIYLVTLFICTNLLQLVLVKTIAGTGGSLIAYILDVIPLIVMVLFAALINQLVKSPSLSIFLCIIIFVALYVLGVLVPQTSGLLFTGYSQWHNLWMGAMLPFGAMISKIGILAGYSLIFAGIGYYLFERREV